MLAFKKIQKVLFKYNMHTKKMLFYKQLNIGSVMQNACDTEEVL